MIVLCLAMEKQTDFLIGVELTNHRRCTNHAIIESELLSTIRIGLASGSTQVHGLISSLCRYWATGSHRVCIMSFNNGRFVKDVIYGRVESSCRRIAGRFYIRISLLWRWTNNAKTVILHSQTDSEDLSWMTTSVMFKLLVDSLNNYLETAETFAFFEPTGYSKLYCNVYDFEKWKASIEESRQTSKTTSNSHWLRRLDNMVRQPWRTLLLPDTLFPAFHYTVPRKNGPLNKML